MSCANAVFMGDAVVDQNYALYVYDDTNALVDSLTFNKGSWFSSALAFYDYLYDLNSVPSLGTDAVVSQNGRVVVQWWPDCRLDFSPSSGTFLTEIGWPGNVQADSTVPLPSTFVTTYPVHEYTRGVEIIGGMSDRAQDGTAYTVSGISQETRTIGLTLDRRDGAWEAELWLEIQRTRLRVGRSVAFWPMNGLIYDPSSTYSYDSDLGYFENLVLPQQGEVRWRPKRLVDAKETVDIEDGAKFHVRQTIPLVGGSRYYRLL